MEEFSEEKQSLLPSRPLPCFLTHVQFLLNHFTVAVNWSRSLSSFGWRGWIKRYAFVPGAAKFAVFFVSDQFCGSQRAWKPCENQATGHIFFLKYVQCGYCRWLSLWLLLQWWNQSVVSVNYKRFTKLQGNVNRPALNDGRGHHSASAGEVTTHQTSLHPEPVLILQMRMCGPNPPLVRLTRRLKISPEVSFPSPPVFIFISLSLRLLLFTLQFNPFVCF